MASPLARLARSSRKCLVFQRRSYATAAAASSSASDRVEEPVVCSLSVSTFKDKYLNLNFSGPVVKKRESDDGLCVFLNMPAGVKEENVKATFYDETKSSLVVRGKIHDESYFGGRPPAEVHSSFMSLPENIDRSTLIFKTEMQDDGILKVTLPKLKLNAENNQQLSSYSSSSIFSNIINKLRFETSLLRLYATIPTLIMTFARPSLVRFLCPRLFDSSTMYKKQTAQSLHIRLTPGLERLDPVTRGLCVSLQMHELNTREIKVFSKGGAFFIQGKTKTGTSKVEYVTGIRLPEFYERRPSMIKEEMLDGIYRATIPIAN